MMWCPALLHAFHWRFLPFLVLWSKQDLTAATLAFCGLFPGKSLSRATGIMGCLPRLSSSLNLCHPDWTLPCRQLPALHLHHQQLPGGGWKCWAIRERTRTRPARAPWLELGRGFNKLVALRKLFVIISSLLLVGSMNFPKGYGQNFMETKWYGIWEA